MKWRSRHSAPDVCDTILPLLSLQADGMASADESRRVETHIAVCDGCRRAQRWMQATHLAIAQRPAVPPPADLRAKIAQAVTAQAAPVVFTTRRPLVLRPAFAAAASLTVVAAAWLGHSLLTAPPATPDAPPPAVAVAPTPVPLLIPDKALRPTPPVKRVAKVTPNPTPPRHAPKETVEKVATAIDTTPSVSVPETALPAAPPRPAAHPKNVTARLLASKPTEPAKLLVKPRVAPHGLSIALEAHLPRPSLPDVTPPVTPTSAPTVVAVKPAEPVAPPLAAPVRTASVTPETTPVRTARREGALSGVLEHLTFHNDNAPRQISMDRSARIHQASFVQAPITYTSTSEDDGQR